MIGADALINNGCKLEFLVAGFQDKVSVDWRMGHSM